MHKRTMTGAVLAAICGLGLAFTSGSALAASDGDAAAKKPAREFGQYSGFEGKEAELGKAVGEAIKSVSPDGSAKHDFSGREEMLGRMTATVIKTINHDSGYQHELNDALVKMTLEHIQFAKRHGLLEELISDHIEQQSRILERVGRLIERTGDKDLALVAVFEQTSCFFQLVDETERAKGVVTFTTPFRTVLAETRALGMFNLTAEEIHEHWTKPRFEGYAKVMGVEFEVSPLGEDGKITVRVL